MNNKYIKFFTVLFLIVFFAGLIFFYQRLGSSKVAVTIEPGMSAAGAAAVLKKHNLIVSKNMFIVIMKVTGLGPKIKKGTYFIRKNASIFGIINMLVEGKSAQVKVTIPEGFNARQVSERLEVLGLGNAGACLKLINDNKLEGYLFPETYYFAPATPQYTVLNAMKAEFDKRFTPELEARAREMKLSKEKVVVLASIVEKEAKVPSERPMIAAVFLNRLKKHWYLESCATVLYALGKHKERLRYKDLKINSPYNTYIHYGLPPAPIASPGMSSINAVLYPAQTDDMFFVVASSGAHNFSRYFNEHLKNKMDMKANRGKSK